MFKVMTWNVENLFRPPSGAQPSSVAAYQQKIQGLATVINAQGPDVVALQEIGQPEALGDLIQAIGGSWDQRLGVPDHRHIRVAWLSRRPITDSGNVISFRKPLQPVQQDDSGGTSNRMGRGALWIIVNADSGQPVRLLTTHLKSKLLTFPSPPGGPPRFDPTDEDERARVADYALYRRAAEAATVRMWATEALADDGQHRAVIVTGDLNDTEQAATTQILLGPPGSEIGTRGFGQGDNGDPQRLWNLSPCMPAGRNFSRVNNGRKELIDHILVSRALVEDCRKPASSVAVEAVIAQPLPSVTNDPTERVDKPSSDHAPVVATFSQV